MATLSVLTGPTQVQAISRAKANKIPPALLNVPGGLYPMMSNNWVIDEYRMLNGWPVPIPDYDIRTQVLVSADGDLISERDSPTALVTGADWRWVADTNFYDQTTLNWAPIQGSAPSWEATPGSDPTLVTDYEYIVGSERFVDMTALNFDSDTGDFMANDLSLVMGGVSGYTIIMAVNPNSIYGNNPDGVVENGLIGPPVNPASTPTTPLNPTGNWAAFTFRGNYLYLTTESIPGQQGVAIGQGLSASQPTFVALVVRRPQTTMYTALGPSHVVAKGLPSGATPEPLRTDFWLGNTGLTTCSTMNMALLDLGIYANPLSKTDVVAEISLLSQVYGGNK